ncbi:MMPL family transporter [Ktedonospora formicarum]|uniref:Membrane protein n=1 Tax=Ktedonospora formicarum TaxID=2778364 RepID=A0A8J3MP56_9CHLR|nr:MMPL family transporter [Ktedonospora formicarum]GHO42565.1 membrane protein [Ktedonospora formicarum]
MRITDAPEETSAMLPKQAVTSPREAHGMYRIGVAYGYFIYRFRWFIIALWVAILAVSAFFALQTTQHLSGGGFKLEGSESVQVSDIMTDKFDQPLSQLTVVFQSTSVKVSEPEYQRQINDFADKARAFKDVKTVTIGETGKDDKTTFVRVGFSVDSDTVQQHLDDFRKLIPAESAQKPARMYLTDGAAIAGEITEVAQKEVERADATALPVALVILVGVFGTFVAACMPLLLALLAIPLAFALIYPIALAMPTSSQILSVVSIIGLGVSIDYSLFIIRRFREELAEGYHVREAIAWTIATAGEAILFSGLTVMIGFLGLLLIDLGLTTSIGIGGAAVVIAAVIAALTLLPAMLSVIGSRINALRVPFLWKMTMPRASDGHKEQEGFWHRLAIGVMKRPFTVIVFVCIILGALAWPALSLRTGTTDEGTLPASSPARQGLTILKDQFPAYKDQNIDVVAQSHNGSDVLSKENLEHLATLTDWLKEQKHVKSVTSVMNFPAVAGGPQLTRDQLIQLYTSGQYKRMPQLVSLVDAMVKDDTAYINVTTDTSLNSDESQALIDHLRADGSASTSNLDVKVGGLQAIYMDFDRYLFGHFPRAILFVIVATFILLLIMFRSLLLPLKAVLMNCLSVCASYGVLVIVFQWGYGSNLLNFTSSGFVDDIIPIMLFCALFGLSMDYEVFLLSRIREEWLHTHNNRQAVALGLEKTGSVITNAALLFIVVTVSFTFTTLTVTKEIGVGMTAAVLVDATIVRSLLVPATMRLLGRWNWWLPGLKVPPKQVDMEIESA